MEKVLMIGPFNEAMKAALEKELSGSFALEHIASCDEYEKITDADYIILRTLNLTADDIASLTKAKLIQRWGVGFDTVDIQAAADKKIPVAITYGINSTPVAEMTLALTLAVYRHLAEQTELIQNGVWDRGYDKSSYTINGKTVGVIGLGNIGRKVAALFQAFGAKVIYYDAYRPSEEAEKAMNITYSELDHIWCQCDIITVHAPLTPETANMVNRESLAKMKKGSVLINTARAELVDHDALAQALSSGHLLGAGLDAIDEDIAEKKPFSGLRNIVLSPHLGGNTADNNVVMAQRCAEQIAAVSAGEALSAPHVVNLHLMK